MAWKKRDDITEIPKVIERNVGDLDSFLNPKRDPYLYGLTEIVEFIKKHPMINVVADYDVDGVCSAVILKKSIEKYGGKVNVIIPHRFSEGYGFSAKILTRLKPGAILTVDNGIAAAKVIGEAKSLGYDCAVIDHHLAPEDGILPDCPILDPHVEDFSEYKEYCGAGLAYRVAKELIEGQDLLEQLLVFASIATVADVMKLCGDNRNIVIDGLSALNEGKASKGLLMLLKVMKICKYLPDNPRYDIDLLDGETIKSKLQKLVLDPYNEEDYGYLMGPAINASGRLFDDGAELPYSLFVEEDEKTMFEKAVMMVERNEMRKRMVEEELSIALSILPEKPEYGVCLYHEKFHPGIVGIIAGKLTEQYHMPAIVLCPSGDPTVIKGSGRSVPGIHLKKVLDQVKDWMLGYGGHAGASGLSLKKDKLTGFREALITVLKDQKSTVSNGPYYDLEISVKDVPKAIEELKRFAPFGEGNPRVIFKVTDIFPDIKGGKCYQVLGSQKQHIKMTAENGKIGVNLFFLADKYNALNNPIYIICYGSVNQNCFLGKVTPEVMADDFEPVNNKTSFFETLEGIMEFI